MTTETREFKAELKQLLHLITHSLYSDREIFLRELVSNASDAIHKIQFNSIDRDDLLEDNKDWKITLIADAEANTLTVRDNGIGMTRDEAIDHLGTIAKSGTKAFLEVMREKRSGDATGLIGQFGVGFYSAYMVADRVTVLTRAAGDPNAVKWTSDGQGEYSIEPAEKTDRGTDVVLHLKDDAKEFLDEYRIRQLVRKFSDCIEHPIVMDVEQETDGTKTTTQETLNNRKAIWLRGKNEVQPAEYDEFYAQISGDELPPAKALHFSTEGSTEFKALLFIPAHRPYSMEWDDPKGGLRLYAQRVLIMERCEELLPPYLRFVKGVVDAADLPLNVSRELLQQNPHLDTIKRNVVRNILSGLQGLKNTEFEKYKGFYEGLGAMLKEGLSRDFQNRDKIADLLLFESDKTAPGTLTTFAEYVEKMPAEQTEIYFLTGESVEQLRRSPYLERFRAKGYDVLLLADPVDEFAIPQFGKYKDKPLQAADRGELKDPNSEISAEVREQFANLLTALRIKLPAVKDVVLSKRLTESAACLVATSGGMGANMERILRKFGEEAGESKRVLELNPDHSAVQLLKDLHTQNPDDPKVESIAELFLDQALIAEGTKVSDPVRFAKRINDLIAMSVKS